MKSSDILKKYRKEHNMTVAKFAELLGVSQVFLTHLEHDRRKISEDLFERLSEFLTEKEINQLRESELYKDVPEEILEKMENLKSENKKLKERYSEIDTRVSNFDKRTLSQYDKTMNEASLFFEDEDISEEDKQKLMLAINEMFFMSKEINKKKYAHKKNLKPAKNKK